jgi:hypothetical protein
VPSLSRKRVHKGSEGLRARGMNKKEEISYLILILSFR